QRGSVGPSRQGNGRPTGHQGGYRHPRRPDAPSGGLISGATRSVETMSDYTPPLSDIAFVLDHITPVEGLTALDAYKAIDRGSVDGVLEEFGGLLAEAGGPTNARGDE